ncbi:hypothetical protein PV11_08718 [Exophiala sideris]|uniref:Uncharacterized protein n=1 Tax=Exophiala sideris TaxID=1016849 RepID=A0A0D1Y1P9_9EURO|nr:hypothetical protein PV11_08718 [Exophiala sideris]
MDGGTTPSQANSPNFLARVEAARGKVLDQHPDAKLYYVKATTKNPEDVTSPSQLMEMEVMFRLDDGVATITSTGQGHEEFGPIDIRPGPILGNANLDWPISLDVSEADTLLKQQGHTGNYDAVTLRKPLYPGMNENYYFFGMVDGPDFSVGTESREVS